MIPQDQLVYSTNLGQQLCGDSRETLQHLPNGSIDLILTSPPFALLRKKSYGNENQEDYVSWLSLFGRAAFEKLKDTGSLFSTSGALTKREGRFARFTTIASYSSSATTWATALPRIFWFNPAKLPSPIEWVNKKKIRAKDSVNTVWWFSKTDGQRRMFGMS